MLINKRLPPFHLLLAFEASGRHLSFKQAAEELFITPPAITYRIKELEKYLEFALFKRSKKKIEFTAAGQSYYLIIHKAISDLKQGTYKVLNDYSVRRLRINVLPFMASEIIIPQLEEFRQAHPDLHLQIDTDSELVDFQLDNIDLAIRFGNGKWPGLIAHKLMNVEISPVCSPLFAKQNNVNRVIDIEGKTLINFDNSQGGWELWCKQLNLKLETAPQEMNFNNYVHVLRAAEQSSGLALGIFPLINLWLETGRLIRPIDISLTMPKSYYLVYREEDQERPDILAFKEWLISILPVADTSKQI
jgi:LysR family glycine cleavage system transcriptional activator